jgi:hypothetical protein
MRVLGCRCADVNECHTVLQPHLLIGLPLPALLELVHPQQATTRRTTTMPFHDVGAQVAPLRSLTCPLGPMACSSHPTPQPPPTVALCCPCTGYDTLMACLPLQPQYSSSATPTALRCYSKWLLHKHTNCWWC